MSSTPTTVELSRWVPAQRHEVFAAWTTQEQLEWFCPEDWKIVSVECDVRLEGGYRAVMEDQDGEQHVSMGAYGEIVPDERLVFTQRWEESHWDSTVVTVELTDDQGGTRINVRETGFDDAGVSKGQESAWLSMLGHLAKHLSTAAFHAAESRS